MARRSQKAPQVQFGDCGVQRRSAGSRQVKQRKGESNGQGEEGTGVSEFQISLIYFQ